MTPSEIDARLGIRFYSTASEGIGGRIRQFLDDFIVKETLIDGTSAGPGGQRSANLGAGGFLVCVLEKKGCDTFSAVRRIAEKLIIDENRIDFGGLKDAHALTYQFITIQRMRPAKIAGFRTEGVKLSPVCRSNRPITAEMLAENEFEISVRNIQLDEEEAKRRTEIIQQEIATNGGVLNFFGHQRFGTRRPVTHIVGKHLLKGEYQRAVLTYLAFPSLAEQEHLNEIRRELLDTMDLKKVYKLFPRRLQHERSLLLHLLRRPNDYENAIRRFPLRLRRLFIHAYQAYLFNRFLSERVRCGLSLTQTERGDEVCEIDARGNLNGEPIKIDRRNASKIGERIGEGRMAIVLPIVGFDTSFSNGGQGQIGRRILSEEKIQKEMFEMSRMPELKSHGGYRCATTKVNMLTDPRIGLDTLNKDMVQADIRFRLPKGSYATTVLREFMKPEDPIAAGY